MTVAVATKPRARKLRVFGPDSAGTVMSPREFDQAEFEEGWRYELINGVLIVSPRPLENERDPNEELGRLLRNYQESHPQGSSLDATLNEHVVRTRRNRRVADRVIWTGLGRLPTRKDAPSIIVEFVSKGKQDRLRDYKEKRTEYLAIGVEEYWIIDRFERTLTVFSRHGGRVRRQVLKQTQTYATDLLPGFELPLARLLVLANRWKEE